MVYLLKMVIFHGYVSHSQMVAFAHFASNHQAAVTFVIKNVPEDDPNFNRSWPPPGANSDCIWGISGNVLERNVATSFSTTSARHVHPVSTKILSENDDDDGSGLVMLTNGYQWLLMVINGYEWLLMVMNDY